MNIAHYFLGFPPFHSGGLMIYATNLAKEQLKMGHKVSLLMPGKYSKNSEKSEIKYYQTSEGLPVYQIINSQPVSFSGIGNPSEFIKPKNLNNFSRFFIENKIEVLHVHSLIGFPSELLDEAKRLNIKTIFTTHDYFGICPKIYLYKYDSLVCKEFQKGKDCVICNYMSSHQNEVRKRNIMLGTCSQIIYKMLRKLAFYLKTKKNKKLNKIQNIIKTQQDNKSEEYAKFRDYYLKIIEKFDRVIFNSNETRKEFLNYVSLNKCNVAPVTHSMIKDNRSKFNYNSLINNKVVFLFMGYLNEEKGFYDLVNVLNDIKMKYSNWKLTIYGNESEICLDDFDKSFFEFRGTYDYTDLVEIFSKASILVMPSKCKETFGFIGLEACSYGIPVLASANVGFGDIMRSKRCGIIYKETENLRESLINILEKPQILDSYHNEILQNDFSLFLMQNHYKNVFEYYRV